MRIAVLADVHGNAPALRAVLAEIDRESVDAIVVAGDVVGGPLVRESLELLGARQEQIHWVKGNSEREAVAAYDGAPVSDDPSGRAAAWSAKALDRGWRNELESWSISLSVDGVCFCHGSPRSDDEILTRSTPDQILLEALGEVSERLVVGGHTHQQMVRTLPGGITYANAGSVGIPYEGRPGAFWMVVESGTPRLRETAYDIEQARAELSRSGFPDVQDQLGDSLLAPVDPGSVTAFFEQSAGRGERSAR